MAAHNIMYKTLRFKWLIEVFCPASAFVSADSDEARNPQRFIHVTVVAKLRKPEISIFNRNYFEFVNNVSIFGN
jgi:hypothetical protein